MPSYKLYYFNLTALGETIRFLLSYGGVDFEDVRIDYEKEWPEFKSKTPMKQMPVLEIDGKPMFQSMAICRYLAKEFKIAGNDHWEDLQIDMIVDTITDLRLKISQVYWASYPNLDEVKWKVVMEEQLPFYMQKLNDLAKENNGHLALGRLTWVDLIFVSSLDYINAMTKKDVIANYSSLKEVKDKVMAIENIKKWIAKRPESFM